MVLERISPKPAFTALDRLFWIMLSRIWSGREQPLYLVKRETVIAWHRALWLAWWRRLVGQKVHPAEPRLPCREHRLGAVINRSDREAG